MFKKSSLFAFIALVAYICSQTTSVEAGRNPFKSLAKWAKGEGSNNHQRHEAPDTDSSDDQDGPDEPEEPEEPEEPSSSYRSPDRRMRRTFDVESRMADIYLYPTTTDEPDDNDDDETPTYVYHNPDESRFRRTFDVQSRLLSESYPGYPWTTTTTEAPTDDENDD